ncbi:MAG: VWA domain-containing protein [Desulfovibrionaceae bacterium]|nr:VWA domain-containing protein [Desulfovibrionaceae bacterium]
MADKLSIPASGALIHQMSGGQEIALDFSPETTSMDLAQDGNDLRMAFENGSEIVLRDFFSFMDARLDLDGVQLDAASFLAAFAPDLATAAGETVAGRLGAYGDDAGNLLGGVDALGTQPGIPFGGESAHADEPLAGAPVPVGAGGGAGPVPPSILPPDPGLDPGPDPDPNPRVSISVNGNGVLDEAFIHGSNNPNGFSGTAWGVGGAAVGLEAGHPVTVTGAITVSNMEMSSGTVSVDGKEVMSLPTEVGAPQTATMYGGEWILSGVVYNGGDQLTITNNGDGTYTYVYTLNEAKEHPGEPVPGGPPRELPLNLEVSVQGTDAEGQAVSPADGVVFTVLDDGVAASHPDKIVLIETPATDYFVTIVLDVSNSMNSAAGPGETRLTLAKEALISLVQEYEHLNGDVKINLVCFNTNVTLQQSLMSPAEAVAAIQGIKASGNTSYAAPLNAAHDTVLDGLTNSAYQGYVNQVFFISDGEPNTNQQTGGGYVPASWLNDIAKNPEYAPNVDIYAIGVGSGALTAKAEDALKAICNPDELGQPGGDTYVHVGEFDALKDALHDLASIATGNIAADNVYGADGVSQFFGYVDAQGDTHVIDWSTVPPDGYYKVSLADDGQGNSAILEVKESGDYILTVHGAVNSADYDQIKILLLDGDGDKLTLDGQIEVWSAQDASLGLLADQGMAFGLGDDKLFFEDMFAQDQDMGEQINQMLSDGQLLLSITDDSRLELTYNNGDSEQTMHISLDDPLDSALVDSLQSDDIAAKTQFLQQFLLQSGIS